MSGSIDSWSLLKPLEVSSCGYDCQERSPSSKLLESVNLKAERLFLSPGETKY